MSTITLPNIRVSSDLTVSVRLYDGGVAIDWTTVTKIRAHVYSDAQRALAGRCAVDVDGDDPTILVCTYAANKPQYLGVNRIIVSCDYMGETKTYDKPAFNFVRWTDDQEGEEIVISDPDIDVEINVEDVTSSILQNILDACIKATEEAREVVDVGRGPRGYSAYEVAVQEGYQGTEEEWLASLVGPAGESAYQLAVDQGYEGTLPEWLASLHGADGDSAYQIAVEEGFVGTKAQWLASLVGPQGLSAYQVAVVNGYQGTVSEWLASLVGPVGPTPAFSIGTVSTGAAGSQASASITGTAEAPVLNLTIPKGDQGNTGSSVDYPYELVNNRTTDDATKGLSAAEGKRLGDDLSQLEADMTNLSGKYYGVFESAAELPEGSNAGYAFVGTEEPLALWNFDGEEWNDTGINIVGLVGPKGEQGIQGIQGIQGQAGVTAAIASVDNNTGTPSVEVSVSDGVISFIFHNIKGEQGNSGYTGAAEELEVVNNTTDGGATKALSAEMGKELQEEIDGFFTPADADLDIEDENGAVLARFEDGGFRVKNFDSAKAPQNGDDIAPDFAIVDENAKAIVVFRDGHIQTKNFDSETLGRTWFYGKKVSIIGDSITTAPNHNAVEFTVLASDISQGRTLQGYPTYYDINTKIGTKTVTSSMVGVLTSFTPGSGDEGKTIGKPLNYNSAGNSGVSSYTETWWYKLATALGMEVLQNVSWSGASICSHEGNNNEYKTSYAWHPAQINKLAKRNADGNTIAPDVVIIYRGTNDMTHTPYASLTDFGADATSIPDTDFADSSYDFKVAYCLTIKKIREAYPQAKIVLCTLNLFKRLNDTQFPTNNGYNTLPEYNNAIREVADMMGCGLIEFDKDGITFENCYPTFISDDSTHPTHPNPTGHTRMAEKAIIDIKNY